MARSYALLLATAALIARAQAEAGVSESEAPYTAAAAATPAERSIPDPGASTDLPNPSDYAEQLHDDPPQAGEIATPRKRRRPSNDAKPGRHNKKNRRRGMLSMLGLGSRDSEGNQKPMPKLPKLTLEEVLTGCFCVAIVGLFLSYSI